MTRLQELSEAFADNPLAELFNPPPLDDTFGALFLGMVLGLMVYGLTVHQAYRYYRLYPNDPLVLKLLASHVYWSLSTRYKQFNLLLQASRRHRLVETFHSILTIDMWSKKLLIPISGLATLLCQGFYAGRAWFVAPQHRMIISLAGHIGGASISLYRLGLQNNSFKPTPSIHNRFRLPVLKFPHYSWMISVMYGAAGLVETIFTGTLIYVLRRSRTGFKRTDAIIDLLILYAVNTGLLLSAIGFLGFLFPLIYPDNLIYVGVSIVETKLYASCVLTALNSRVAIMKRASGLVEVSSSRAELAKEVDSERGHGQRTFNPDPNAAWNF
ncbi:hypothetical protein V8D89_011827 [Ganoderma adspersum]